MSNRTSVYRDSKSKCFQSLLGVTYPFCILDVGSTGSRFQVKMFVSLFRLPFPACIFDASSDESRVHVYTFGLVLLAQWFPNSDVEWVPLLVRAFWLWFYRCLLRHASRMLGRLWVSLLGGRPSLDLRELYVGCDVLLVCRMCRG